jgi:hypothetical protein
MYGCRALAELAYTDASLSDRLIAVPFMPALGGKSDARRDQCCSIIELFDNSEAANAGSPVAICPKLRGGGAPAARKACKAQSYRHLCNHVQRA